MNQDEIDFIVDNYKKLTDYEISQKLNRSRSSIRNYASRYNLKKREPGEISLQSKFIDCKTKALDRNYSFNITLEQYSEIVKKDCYYCNQPPAPKHAWTSNGRKGKIVFINGVDRINNSIGYELENCVPCCGICNTMKMDLTLEEFFSKISTIYLKHLKDEGNNGENL